MVSSQSDGPKLIGFLKSSQAISISRHGLVHSIWDARYYGLCLAQGY
jgi:hypothetical protein